MFGLSPYVLGTFAAIVVALATFGGCEHHNAKVARAERAAAEAARDTAIDANKSNVETVAALEKSVREWKALATPADDVKAKAAQAEQFAVELLHMTDELAALKRKDRETPECDALMRISVTAACPSVAAGLRELARGHKDSSSGNPGAGPGPAAGKSDGGLRTAVSVPGR